MHFHTMMGAETPQGQTELLVTLVGQLPLDFNATPVPEPLPEPLPMLSGLAYLHEGYSVLGLTNEFNTCEVHRPKNAPLRPGYTENLYRVSVALGALDCITAMECTCPAGTKKEHTGPCRHKALVQDVAVWIAALKRALPFLETYTLGSCWARGGVEMLEMVGPLGSAKFLVARLRGSKTVGVVVNDTAEALRWAELGLLGETGGQG